MDRAFPGGTQEDEREILKRTGVIFLVHYESIDGRKYHSIFRFYPRIWVLGYFDLVVEFIAHGSGELSSSGANHLCQRKKTI